MEVDDPPLGGFSHGKYLQESNSRRQISIEIHSHLNKIQKSLCSCYRFPHNPLRYSCFFFKNTLILGSINHKKSKISFLAIIYSKKSTFIFVLFLFRLNYPLSRELISFFWTINGLIITRKCE